MSFAPAHKSRTICEARPMIRLHQGFAASLSVLARPLLFLNGRGATPIYLSPEVMTMSDTKDKIKDGIDKIAQGAKNATEKVAEKASEAAQNVGEKVKEAGEKIKDAGR